MDDPCSESCTSRRALAFHIAVLLAAAVVALSASLTGCAALAYQEPVALAPTDLPSVPQRIVVTPTAVTAPTQPPTPTQLPAATPTSTAHPPFAEGPFPIGYSVQGRPILAYRFGHGPGTRAVVGGLHGGYEWNTVMLMTRTVEHLTAHPQLIPPHLTLYVIPLVNPDGLAAGTDRTQGRMNANQVDLNRNWDFQWQMTATHGIWPVFAGQHSFSEPETIALRDFIVERNLDAVVFYHSAYAATFSGAGITTSQTVELARVLAEATGYRYAPEGMPGQITTGNAIDWLTANGITAVEVELTNHQDLDWEQNLRGLAAFLGWIPADR